MKVPISRLVPASIARTLRRLLRRPAVGRVDFGSLRRLTPISRDFGLDRGKPIDRFYIERFLETHSRDVAGRVLEVATDMYTRRFGGDRVTQSDVLHVEGGLPGITIVGDLTDSGSLPSGAFDCVILTQTLNMIYDIRAALTTVYGSLRRGGVLLATLPGLSQVSRHDDRRWGDHWRLTPTSARHLAGQAFPGGDFVVESFGNVLSTIGFLHGLAAEELDIDELEYRDPDYPLLIAIRARKATGGV